MVYAVAPWNCLPFLGILGRGNASTKLKLYFACRNTRDVGKGLRHQSLLKIHAENQHRNRIPFLNVCADFEIVGDGGPASLRNRMNLHQPSHILSTRSGVCRWGYIYIYMGTIRGAQRSLLGTLLGLSCETSRLNLNIQHGLLGGHAATEKCRSSEITSVAGICSTHPVILQPYNGGWVLVPLSLPSSVYGTCNHVE